MREPCIVQPRDDATGRVIAWVISALAGHDPRFDLDRLGP
jgi:hypothetical protein